MMPFLVIALIAFVFYTLLGLAFLSFPWVLLFGLGATVCVFVGAFIGVALVRLIVG